MNKHTAITNGKTIWVNSDMKCVLRVCGIDRLKGMESVNAMVSLSLDGMMDVTIIDKLFDGGENNE